MRRMRESLKSFTFVWVLEQQFYSTVREGNVAIIEIIQTETTVPAKHEPALGSQSEADVNS